MTRVFCDRCGRVIEGSDLPDKRTITLKNHGGHDLIGEHWDVCGPCIELFKEWLRDPAVTGTLLTYGFI